MSEQEKRLKRGDWRDKLLTEKGDFITALRAENERLTKANIDLTERVQRLATEAERLRDERDRMRDIVSGVRLVHSQWLENHISRVAYLHSLAQAWREADAAQAGKEGSKPFYDHGSLVEPADWRDGNDPHDGKDTDADEA
jgi:predicted nuclease with TOPRIM domain